MPQCILLNFPNGLPFDAFACGGYSFILNCHVEGDEQREGRTTYVKSVNSLVPGPLLLAMLTLPRMASST